MDQEYNLPCKSCGHLYSKTSILKHLNQQKTKTCKSTYSNEEIQDLEKQSKEIQRMKRNDRERAKYDPERRKKKYDPEQSKATYDSIKRKQRYQEEKDRVIPYENVKAKKSQRDWEWTKVLNNNLHFLREAIYYTQECYLRLQKMSKEGIFKINKLPVGNNGKKMTEKYINELQESALPKEMVASFTEILNDFLEVFENVEKKIEKIWWRANNVKFLEELRAMYTDIEKSGDLWKPAFKKAEEIIISYSDHVEDANTRTIGPPSTTMLLVGLLQRPKLNPCNDGETCRNCIKA